jgi:hypothetical protein
MNGGFPKMNEHFSGAMTSCQSICSALPQTMLALSTSGRRVRERPKA